MSRGKGIVINRACPLCGHTRPLPSHGRAPYCAPCRQIRDREKMRKWQTAPQGRYRAQMDMAAKRGIVWQFTFESWLTWWGDDLGRRGPGADELNMARYGDAGPYSPANCYKATRRENTREQCSIRWGQQ